MPRSCELVGVSGKGRGEVDGEAGNRRKEVRSEVVWAVPLPQASPLLPPGYADLAIEGEETCRGAPLPWTVVRSSLGKEGAVP